VAGVLATFGTILGITAPAAIAGFNGQQIVLLTWSPLLSSGNSAGKVQICGENQYNTSVCSPIAPLPATQPYELHNWWFKGPLTIHEWTYSGQEVSGPCIWPQDGQTPVAVPTGQASSTFACDADFGPSAPFQPPPSSSENNPSSPSTTTSVLGSGKLIDHKTGRCLDSNSRGRVYTLPCNGGRYQIWDETSAGELMNSETGLCLQGGMDRVHVRTTTCGHTAGWEFGNVPDNAPVGTGTLTDGAYDVPGQLFALDSNYSGHVYEGPTNDGPYQLWHATGSLARLVNVGD
jgi:serine/threonine-protein kinase